MQGLRHHSASGSATEPEPPEDSRPASCPLKCPSRSSAPASVFGRGVRIDSFLPTYISRTAKLLFLLLRTTRDNREGPENGELGRGREKAIKVWGTSQHCHTQDGGAAVARSFRGGTNACAAQSPGPGHKMAAAALGRARRRRQNGRSSRTCGRIPSSPLRAGKSPRKPWSCCEPRQGLGVRSRMAEAPPALPARGCRSPGLLRRRHLRPAGGQQGRWLG